MPPNVQHLPQHVFTRARTITRLSTNLLMDTARATPSGDPTLRLAKIEHAAVRRAERLVWHGVIPDNDGECFGRAVHNAAIINEVGRRALGAPAEQATAGDAYAGVALVRRSLGYDVDGGARQWDFHAVAMHHKVGDFEPTVHDPALFDSPVPLSFWARRIGVHVSEIEMRPVRYGYSNEPLRMSTVRTFTGRMLDKWKVAEKTGVDQSIRGATIIPKGPVRKLGKAPTMSTINRLEDIGY